MGRSLERHTRKVSNNILSMHKAHLHCCWIGSMVMSGEVTQDSIPTCHTSGFAVRCVALAAFPVPLPIFLLVQIVCLSIQDKKGHSFACSWDLHHSTKANYRLVSGRWLLVKLELAGGINPLLMPTFILKPIGWKSAREGGNFPSGIFPFVEKTVREVAFGEVSFRGKVHSEKRPFWENSVRGCLPSGMIPFGEISFGEKSVYRLIVWWGYSVTS